jgi:hypothetical protein
MDVENLARTLFEVKARQDILQCIYRYAHGVDRLDREMLLSAYHLDAIDDHGICVGTPAQFADYFFEFNQKRKFATHHNIGNHLCDLDGDIAHTETYYIYVSRNTDDPPMSMAGGRYIDRFEYRDGRWAIAARKCTIEWDWGTDDAVLPEDMLAAFAAVGEISRDRKDLSYDRPLRIDPMRIGKDYPF